MFGGSDIGDELIMPMSFWQGSVKGDSKDKGLEHIVLLDDKPISVRLFPQFRIRKKASDFREFERWIFELVNRADGKLRELWIVKVDSGVVSVDYGLSKFVGVKRHQAGGVYSSSWSDEIIVLFQSSQQPKFFDWA